MTAIDVQMARELVTKLSAIDFSNDATATYSRDAEFELENISSPTISVDSTLQHNRIARETWSRTVTVSVTAVSPQEQRGKPGDSAVETEKDDWLTFIDDELIAAIQAEKLSGKKPMEIQFQQRMDPARLRNESVFYSQFQITFPHV